MAALPPWDPPSTHPAAPAPGGAKPPTGVSRAWIAATLATLVVVGGGYVAACALAPLPKASAQAPKQAEKQAPAQSSAGFDEQAGWVVAIDGEAPQALVHQYTLPTAVGWLDGTDDAVWTNDTSTHPIASITKLVTVLVGQERDALKQGEDGPSYSWSAADQKYQADLAAEGGIAYPLPVGTEVTRRELLKMALVGSANDFAAAYTRSIFGDDATFLAAVNDWSERHGFDSLTVIEPTGMDGGNSASADDVVRISRLALADPVLAELVGTDRITMPWGIGEVKSTNPLFGTVPGVIGIKTGRSDEAGFALTAGVRHTIEGRDVTAIAVTLQRTSLDQRTADQTALLTALTAMPEKRSIVTEGGKLGEMGAAAGGPAQFTAAKSHREVLVPGELATVAINENDRLLRVTGPSGEHILPLEGGDGAEDDESTDGGEGTATTDRIEEATIPGDPDLWWRLTHPGELFFGR